MKEVLFIRNNIEKWRAMEELIANIDFEMPDRLVDVYTELTADLAFAQTHYPRSRITVYLNNLASALHNEIYRNRREKWSRLLTFWTQEVPDVMWKERRLLLLSFVIFMASVLTGVVSTLGDSSFPRLILGDGYMDMTLENIAQGRPMGVYGSEEEGQMFLGITLNNVMVSFNMFVSGVLTSFMPGFLLFRNGIMVGCFDTFFFHLLPSGEFPERGEAGHEDRCRHCPDLHPGRFHRGVHHPSYGDERLCPPRHHPPVAVIHRILFLISSL